MIDQSATTTAARSDNAASIASQWAARDMPAMATNPPLIFFTDFDGTITMADSNDYMTDNFGFGHAKRRQANLDVIAGLRTFRETFQEMIDSIETPFEACLAAVKEHVKLDPDFQTFFSWARAQNVPVVVISGGMEVVVRELLVQLLGPDEAAHIQVVSNHKAEKATGSGWTIRFRHPDSPFGNDKSVVIKPYRRLPDSVRPVLMYAGDGVSDLSAAQETDLLFAKKGMDLVTWCVQEKVPFTEFSSWADILAGCKKVLSGQATVQELAQAGHEAYLARQTTDA